MDDLITSTVASQRWTVSRVSIVFMYLSREDCYGFGTTLTSQLQVQISFVAYIYIFMTFRILRQPRGWFKFYVLSMFVAGEQNTVYFILFYFILFHSLQLGMLHK